MTAPGVSSAVASQGYISSVLALPHGLFWFLFYSFVPYGQGLNQFSFKWHPEAGKKEDFFSHWPFFFIKNIKLPETPSRFPLGTFDEPVRRVGQHATAIYSLCMERQVLLRKNRD